MSREMTELKELLTEALSTAKKRPDGVYYDYTLYFPVLRSELPIEDELYYCAPFPLIPATPIILHPLSGLCPHPRGVI